MKMTKKALLLVTLIGTLLFVVVDSVFSYKYCFTEGRCWRLYEVIQSIMPLSFFFLATFLLSLITYKLRDEVFRAWLRFAYWWVPASILLTLLASGGGGGGGFGMHSFGGEDVALILSVFFFVISLIIIVIKSWKLRGE